MILMVFYLNTFFFRCSISLELTSSILALLEKKKANCGIPVKWPLSEPPENLSSVIVVTKDHACKSLPKTDIS